MLKTVLVIAAALFSLSKAETACEGFQTELLIIGLKHPECLIGELDPNCLTYLPVLSEDEAWKACLAEIAGVDPEDIDYDKYLPDNNHGNKKDDKKGKGRRLGTGMVSHDSVYEAVKMVINIFK